MDGDSVSANSGDSGGLLLGSARGRWVIAVTVLGSGIATIDATVVGIALPTIGRNFHSSLGPLQWVVTGYSLTLAAFLLLGGSLGDRFGRKKIFMVGVAWFAVASTACGIAPNATILILMRLLQGVGGALLTPGSLAIIQASFSKDDRPKAIGTWSGLGGLAAATGPVLGGYLITAASWRLIFFINVPISIFVLLVSARHVPESRDPSAQAFTDIWGAGLAVVSLAGINYSLIEGSALGWGSSKVLASVVVAVAASIAFVVIEQRSASPMLNLQIFKNRQFSATNAVTFVVYAALSGALFFLPIELQVVAHYSAFGSGFALIPVTFIMLIFSARSGRLAGRIGPRLQMTVGPFVIAGGLALLVRAPSGSNYFEYVLPAVLVFGTGLAITVAPLTTTVMGSVSSEHAGIASAVNNDVARIAGLVAVAILPWLAGIGGSAYLHPHQLASGFRTAVLISAVLCAAGGVLSAFQIRNPKPGDDQSGATYQTRGAEPMHCALDAPPLKRT
jgi:EmrB/QacA subfamily drug resistance transporter